jgi:hypothetical protein
MAKFVRRAGGRSNGQSAMALIESFLKKRAPRRGALRGVWSGSFCLLIDDRLRNFRQGLVSDLFFVERFLEELGRLIETSSSAQAFGVP